MDAHQIATALLIPAVLIVISLFARTYNDG